MKDIDARLMMEALREADYEVPQDADALARAKKRGYDEPSDVDHHNQYMMDQDLLNPLHKAAQEAGAKDLNDWIIKQLKTIESGAQVHGLEPEEAKNNWYGWFIDTVIKGDY